MPHIAGHREGEPVLDFSGAFAEPEPVLDFSDAFGVGQPRTQQKFVSENNSLVNMPATSSVSFDSRESKEFIEGQEGFFGNTSTAGLFELLNAPGGLIDAFVTNDFKKFPGGIARDFVETVAGGLRERVLVGLEERKPTGEFFQGREIEPFAEPLLDVFIKKNPELAARFNEKMLELQEANEDFLIRNGLLFGPDDQPTILGNALSQFGTSVSMIVAAIYLKDPRLPALAFGLIQQVSGFEQAEEAGKDVSTAADIGLVQGSIEAGISLIGIARLTKIIGSKSSSVAVKIAASMVTEGIEEAVTEALIIGVQNATGVTDLTLGEALVQVFQAAFYGALLGAGTTGAITATEAAVKRIVGDSISQEDTGKIARIVEVHTDEAATEIIEQDIDDANTELEIGRDLASDQPVTKAAKTTGEQQQRVIKILTAMNEGKEFNVQEALDEIDPEAAVQRRKQILEEGRRATVKATTKQAIRQEVVQLQAEIQIAEQQGNEEEAARLSERINEIQQLAFADESLFEAVEELEAEGIFPQGEKFFDDAVAAIDNVLRPLRAGVQVGRALQKAETRALQDSLTAIVDRLGKAKRGEQPIITPETRARLQRKVREVSTIKNVERVRRDIISLARKGAFRTFVSTRRAAIDKTIKTNTKSKKAELAPGYQNALDRLNKLRKGIKKAAGDDAAVIDFNAKQGERIASEMDQGIPTEGLVLQVRYLDILNQRAKVTPQVLARFEDDLNAFIASGKGIATAARAEQQAKVDRDKAQILGNKVKTGRAGVEGKFLVGVNATVDFLSTTYDTLIVALGAEGTVLDMFDNDVRYKTGLNDRGAEIRTLAASVSDGNGSAYLKEISQDFFKENVIDLPREGLTKILGGNQPKNIRMTRGELIYAWMILQEPSIREQIIDPEGQMAWTPEFVSMIETRISEQDERFALGVFEFYDGSYDRFNEVYRNLNNRDLPKVERYSHLRRPGEENLSASVHNETMFADLIVGPEDNPSSLATGEPGEVKKRQANAVAEIKIDNILNSLARYNYDVEHYIAYAEDLYLTRKMLNDEDFVRHAQEILGKAGYQTFFSHLKTFSRKNISAKKYLAWLEKFRQFQFKSTLLANPKIGIGQLASISAWAADMPKGTFGAGISSYAANPDAANKILNQHPTFKNRELNFDPDIDQLGPVSDLFHLLALPIRKGDAFAVRSGAWARYKWLVDEMGVPKDKALKQVARFAERSQQSVLASQRTLAQKSDDPLVRALTMYKSSLTAMLNVSMQSIIRYRQADKSTPQKKADARSSLIQTLAIQNLVIPATFAFLTGGNIPRTVLVGSLAGIAGVGELIEVLAGILVNIFAEEDDRIYVGGVLDVPADEAFEEIQRKLVALGDFGENLLDGGIDQALSETDMGAFFEGIVDITDTFTPFPITNLLNMAEGTGEAVGLTGDDPIDGTLKALGYKSQARERMLKRIDAVTGEESATITPAGAF